MSHPEGRSPFSLRRVAGTALITLLAAAALVRFGPELVDAFGYERVYSRTDPDGRRFQLEHKVRTWLPGPDCRCVVFENDGSREVHPADDCAETAPEQRIRAALRGKPGE
jgi:hypothetical protein